MTQEQLNQLTPEQRRVRIATVCGWKNIGTCTCGVQSRGEAPDGHEGHLPNYLVSLDACHEMEKALPRELVMAYDTVLRRVVAETTTPIDALWEGGRDVLTLPFHATAEQRAAAFLLIVG